MCKAIFFFESLVDDFQFKRFGFCYLRKKGIEYEIYNISGYTRKKYFEYTKGKKNYSINLTKKKEIIKKIKSLDSKDIVFFYISLRLNTIFIVNLLNKRKIKYVQFNHGFMPIFSYTFSQKFFIFLNYPIVSIRHLLRNSLLRFFKMYFFKPYYYIYVFNNTSLKNLKNKFKIPINVPDIDHDRFLIYKRRKNNTKTKKRAKKKYALYLESPFNHPDAMFENDRLPPERIISYKNYYTPLKTFLNFVKNNFQLNINIFLHPKSNLKNYPIPHLVKVKSYSNLEVFENCEFVLLHQSTALKLAILFNKPVVFLYQDNFSKSNKNNIGYLSKIFKKKFINFSSYSLYKNEKLEFFYSKNNKNFANFEKKYISSYSTNKTSYEIYYKKIFNI